VLVFLVPIADNTLFLATGGAETAALSMQMAQELPLGIAYPTMDI